MNQRSDVSTRGPDCDVPLPSWDLEAGPVCSQA